MMKHLIPPDIKYSVLPRDLRHGMKRYIESGILPGSFLRACISNRFTAAVLGADVYNSLVLYEIALFLSNEAPAPCWGSPSKMLVWSKTQQEGEPDPHQGPLPLLP